LTADAVSICLENQKNGKKNAVLHRTKAWNTAFCPVWAAANLVHKFHGRDTAPLGTFIDELGRTYSVQTSDVCSAIRVGASSTLRILRFQPQAYWLSQSSIWRCLKLAGHDNDIIMKLGRWSSNTYFHYIQSQIGKLTADIATGLLHFHQVSS
jgi:hypothetical protein